MSDDDACDLSEVRALTRAAERELSRIPQIMLDVVQNRAALERRTHKFQNITGRLERNTRGQIVSGDQDPVTVELVMTMPYASHVLNRGRTAIDDRADEAEVMIQSRLDDMAERLGNK